MRSGPGGGMIMIDPAFGAVGRVNIGIGHLPINPINPLNPTHPTNPVVRPPISTSPILRGGVTFGLRLQSQDIKVEITDQVARTYIVQTFINDGDQNLAGTYLFPLPEDTTFSSFSLHIDGKPVEGKILEAREARAEYEAIVRRMVDPGLLEFADYKTVRARIFPIPAHGTKKVELEYTQLLKAENGMVKYRFPFKGDSAAQGDVEESKLSVKLSGKQGLRTIWSPSHSIDVKREDNNRAKINFAASGASAVDKDFLLYYSVSVKDVQANLLTHKTSTGGGDSSDNNENNKEDGYFLLTLAPPVKNTVVQSKDIVLIADTSGSMQGDKIQQTRKALKYVVNALSENDRFGIVQFNTDADTFKNNLLTATAENKKAAFAFIDELEPRGGTNISEALNSGVALLNNVALLNHNDSRPAYLVLMTDGEPTVGETSLSGVLKAVKSKRDLRLFDFGVGYDVNTRLLSQLAEEHHGTSQFLEPGENLESALAAFYNKIKSPVLSDCQISYAGVTVKDVYPKAVKDIFAGTQVLLLGRYKGSGKATVTVSGKVNGQAKSYAFPLDFASDQTGHGYLPRLWAMRRIGHLSEVAQANGDNREVVDEIVALSKKYGIISAYTSFLVTDPSENHRLANAGVGGAVPAPMSMPRRSLLQGRGDSFNNSPAGFASGIANESSGGPVDKRWQFAPNTYGVQRSAASWAKVNFYSPASHLAVIDAAPVTGQQAVMHAKSLAMLKDSDDSFVSAADRKEQSKEMKQAAGKTFYLSDDCWTDADYKGEKAETIVFASQRYFDLARSSNRIASCLAVGKQVIFIEAGHAYKIVLK